VSRRPPPKTSVTGATTQPRVVETSAVVQELRAIELRFAPQAGSGAGRFRAQLDDWRRREADEELQFEIPESFARVLFARLCERYGITAHRHVNDPMTICASMPPGFANEILWPQYDAMGAEIARFVHGDVASVIAAWLGPAG
jgi:hypothetical protein